MNPPKKFAVGARVKIRSGTEEENIGKEAVVVAVSLGRLYPIKVRLENGGVEDFANSDLAPASTFVVALPDPAVKVA